MTNRTFKIRPLLLLLTPIFFSGCAVGLRSLIFVTKTDVAVDIDTEPPSLDVGYDREEFVLAPIFSEGQVLPVISSIGTDAGASFSSDASFATGDAALILADNFTKPNDYQFATKADKGQTNTGIRSPRTVAEDRKVNTHAGVVVTEFEKLPDGFWGNIWYFFTGSSKRKRYFFGTDTSFGLHVEWSGNSIPRAVNIGYKRKELAYIPLMESPALKGADGESKEVATEKSLDADGALEDKALVQIRLASLIATSGVRTKLNGPLDTNPRIVQTFATGDAATLLAANAPIRRVVGQAIIPQAREIEEQKKKFEKQQESQEAINELKSELFSNYEELSDDGKKTTLSIAKGLEILEDPDNEKVDEFDKNVGLKVAQPSSENSEKLRKLNDHVKKLLNEEKANTVRKANRSTYITDIKGMFNGFDSTKKTKVLIEAKAKKLVDNNTTTANFVTNLEKLNSSTSSLSQNDKIREFRGFVKGVK